MKNGNITLSLKDYNDLPFAKWQYFEGFEAGQAEKARLAEDRAKRDAKHNQLRKFRERT